MSILDTVLENLPEVAKYGALLVGGAAVGYGVSRLLSDDSPSSSSSHRGVADGVAVEIDPDLDIPVEEAKRLYEVAMSTGLKPLIDRQNYLSVDQKVDLLRATEVYLRDGYDPYYLYAIVDDWLGEVELEDYKNYLLSIFTDKGKRLANPSVLPEHTKKATRAEYRRLFLGEAPVEAAKVIEAITPPEPVMIPQERVKTPVEIIKEQRGATGIVKSTTEYDELSPEQQAAMLDAAYNQVRRESGEEKPHLV